MMMIMMMIELPKEKYKAIIKSDFNNANTVDADFNRYRTRSILDQFVEDVMRR